MKDIILREFDDSKGTLVDLKGKMIELLSDLIKNKLIPTHQINGRVKERISLEGKINRKQDKYTSLDEITDIVGIRIITFLESDVDKIASIIEEEFEVDEENSIDKRKLNSDQFGYRSLHFVVSCNKTRARLVEYKRFKKLKFEIQIRSILQHAWAEIEHDLGYKGIRSIPDAYKRSFNRLAALLESADLEFDRLKKELDKYELEVEDLIENEPENVSIDQASMISFVRNNKTIVKAQNLIAKNVGCSFSDSIDYKRLIELFNDFFKVKNISKLNSIVEENGNLFIEFINLFTENLNYDQLPGTITIVYLQHFLSAKDEDQNIVDEYIKAGSFGPEKGRFIKLIQKAKLNIANNK